MKLNKDNVQSSVPMMMIQVTVAIVHPTVTCTIQNARWFPIEISEEMNRGVVAGEMKEEDMIATTNEEDQPEMDLRLVMILLQNLLRLARPVIELVRVHIMVQERQEMVEGNLMRHLDNIEIAEDRMQMPGMVE